MRIPSSSALIAYFANLGINLKRIERSWGQPDSYAFDANSPYGERTFENSRELWLDWCSYAAYRLRQRRHMTKAFLDAWKLGTGEDQLALYAALREYALSGESLLLEDLFKHVPESSAYCLPKNWKLLMKCMMESNDLRSFPARTMDAITNYGKLRLLAENHTHRKAALDNGAAAAAIYPLRFRNRRSLRKAAA